VGALVVARGEVWWGESPDEKGRPFLVVSRDAANLVMGRVLVAPVTSRVREVPSELALGVDEGLPRPSVASFDNIRPFPKSMLVRRLGVLGASRRHELCAVAAVTLDC
jgi:mRNA interferase MazF